MDSEFKIKVNGRFQFNLDKVDVDELNISKDESGQIHLLYNSNSYHVRVIESDLDKKYYTIAINDREHRVAISDSLDQLISDMGLTQRKIQEVDSITAPMPGMILELMVNEEQEVKENDPILILEAMKMENIIKSPRNGKISAIHIKVGQAIEKNELLIEYE